jgi:hypothetical protein
MTEQEAVNIALAFAEKEQIQHEGVVRAFFVPLEASCDPEEGIPPDAVDEWVVHLSAPPRDRGGEIMISFDDSIIIVAVDANTGSASQPWML